MLRPKTTKSHLSTLHKVSAPESGSKVKKENHEEKRATEKVKPRKFHVFRIHEVDGELKQFDQDLAKNIQFCEKSEESIKWLLETTSDFENFTSSTALNRECMTNRIENSKEKLLSQQNEFYQQLTKDYQSIIQQSYEKGQEIEHLYLEELKNSENAKIESQQIVSEDQRKIFFTKINEMVEKLMKLELRHKEHRNSR